MNTQSKKYRPSLPPHLITHILELAKKEVPISRNSLDLIAILVPFEAKIAAGCVTPAYETAKREDKRAQESNLFNELGGALTERSINQIDKERCESKEQYWEACYKKYKATPEDCTLAEIDAAREWAYLEGLMSPEEVAAFEAECR